MSQRSIRVLTTALAAGVVLLAGQAAAPATAALPASGLATQDAASVPDGLREVQSLSSLLGVHTWYQQVSDGHPVVGGWYALHRDFDGTSTADDGRIPDSRLQVPASVDSDDFISARRAVTAATEAAPELTDDKQSAEADEPTPAETESTPADADTESAESEGVWILPATSSRPARYVYSVLTVSGHGSAYHYVDAVTARVLATDKISQHARGKGQVLDPNPVVKLQDETLRDKRNSKAALPKRAYTKVRLRHLRGKSLTGKWVTIINKNAPVSKKHRFFYFRDDGRFEMVNAYHAIDRSQTYLHKIGFKHVNAESQKVKTNAFPVDNSFYEPGRDRILFGAGGVDDAEDLEVVWHEYGHAIQDAQVPGFGASLQAGSIGEAFGDYWAVTMSQANSPDTTTTPLPCVADWDSVSYTTGKPHCLRRTDTDKVFPDDIVHEVHSDGEIWSRALWDINQALGRKAANRVIVEAQFNFTPKIGFKGAAERTVETAQALYGDSAAASVHQAFVDRGILADA